MLGVEGGALIEKGFAWGFGVGVVERALRTETVVMGDEAQLQSGNLLVCTKVQRLSFEYFTSRGCSTNRDEEVNWVIAIPNSLSLYPICCLCPC